MDTKLKWTKHILEKCRETQKIIHNLKYCLRRKWGLNTNTLKTLYKSIILPKLLYGCTVWCRATSEKSCLSKLRKVLREMLLSVTRSFKSVPTSSLLVISSLLPIHLKILEMSAHRLISCYASSFSPSSLKTIESVFDSCDLSTPVDQHRRFFSSEFPP